MKIYEGEAAPAKYKIGQTVGYVEYGWNWYGFTDVNSINSSAYYAAWEYLPVLETYKFMTITHKVYMYGTWKYKQENIYKCTEWIVENNILLCQQRVIT